jgi:ferric-dicitrate binding protein FerR (iron transport regulator)
MTRIEELLFLWREGTISDDERAELKNLLREKDGRRELFEDFSLIAGIRDALITEEAADARDIGESPPRRSTFFIWIGLAAMIVLFAALVAINNYRHCRHLRGIIMSAKIDDVTHTVTIVRDGQPMGAMKGFVLLDGDSIQTNEESSVSFSYPAEQTVIELGPNTAAALAGAEHYTKLLYLGAGRLKADIAPQPEGFPMTITTPHARAEVMGTRLTILTTPTTTRLEVREGLVRLTRLSDGAYIDVAAGYVGVVAPGAPLTAQPLPAEP